VAARQMMRVSSCFIGWDGLRANRFEPVDIPYDGEKGAQVAWTPRKASG
jgi:hypothetical protein